jgi:hypothetical protein
MKIGCLAVTLLGLLVFASAHVEAQAYGPYYYGPYSDAIQYHQYLQQHDPYYELHLMHYQLYLRQYQPHQIYQPCCYAFGLPVWSTPTSRVPQTVIAPRPQSVRRK